ncbi:MAG: hypothetical protein HZB56_11375 [Deltaproteobacteria bacterium]|nr:hypothetical protein [Deltaproteobacteria bacterium]
MSHARRKSPDLRIRLSAAERARLERAARKAEVRGVSTWARTVLLREALVQEPEAARRARTERLIAAMRQGFPGDAEHADEVERNRERWRNADR